MPVTVKIGVVCTISAKELPTMVAPAGRTSRMMYVPEPSGPNW